MHVDNYVRLQVIMSGVLGTITLGSWGAVAINAVKVRHGTARKVGIDWVDLGRV